MRYINDPGDIAGEGKTWLDEQTAQISPNKISRKRPLQQMNIPGMEQLQFRLVTTLVPVGNIMLITVITTYCSRSLTVLAHIDSNAMKKNT